MGTIELSKIEEKILGAIVENVKAIDLKEKTYRIRDMFIVLRDHFKKDDPLISRDAMRYPVKKLEVAVLLKKVAKTKGDKDKNGKVVYELQLEKFCESQFVIIENRYSYNRKNKINKAEKSTKLKLLPWFKLEPNTAPAEPLNVLESEIMQIRDGIQKEVARLEKLLEQESIKLKRANEAIDCVGEARKFLEENKKNTNYVQRELEILDQEETATDKILVELLPREKKVLRGIVEYLKETGGNQIISIEKTLVNHFSMQKVKISHATIYKAVQGLTKIGLLKRLPVKKWRAFVFKFNKKLYEDYEASDLKI